MIETTSLFILAKELIGHKSVFPVHKKQIKTARMQGIGQGRLTVARSVGLQVPRALERINRPTS